MGTVSDIWNSCPGKFPMAAIPALQGLLTNEYSRFCILCWAPIEGGEKDSNGVAIFAQKLLVTSRLARLAAIA
jgi:hypothetical protein